MSSCFGTEGLGQKCDFASNANGLFYEEGRGGERRGMEEKKRKKHFSSFTLFYPPIPRRCRFSRPSFPPATQLSELECGICTSLAANIPFVIRMIPSCTIRRTTNAPKLRSSRVSRISVLYYGHLSDTVPFCPRQTDVLTDNVAFPTLRDADISLAWGILIA